MTEVNFGYRRVSAEEKTTLVTDVFERVAARYDVMNDLMSLGTHRLFKQMLVQMSGVRPGNTVVDLAGGTGDVSAIFAKQVGSQGRVFLTDPNAEMLKVGRTRLWDKGLANVTFTQSPGEQMPFPDATFDVACISFGLRNFTDKDQALKEIYRCLKPGCPLLVLEFSQPTTPLLKQAYEAFQNLWPIAGQAIVGESQPYQYLVESIRVHPDQLALKQMFEDAGYIDCQYDNLIGGIAAIHRGVRP